MNHYIIDGNNLIGKSRTLFQLQKKDKQGVREKLVHMLVRYSERRKNQVSLHFDGFQKSPINSSPVLIYYSGSRKADDVIKEQISSFPVRGNLVVVSSDRNIMEYARVCNCKLLSAEEFIEMISFNTPEDEEKKRIEEMKNNEEFRKLFGTKPTDSA